MYILNTSGVDNKSPLFSGINVQLFLEKNIFVMAIIHQKLILALEYMYFQAAITIIKVFIASEGSKMVKSEKMRSFKQLKPGNCFS